MSLVVSLATNTIDYPQGGGHFWVYLNWALGLHTLGCHVIWLEGIRADAPAQQLRADVAALKNRLSRYGLADYVALYSWTGNPLPDSLSDECLGLEAASEADLLLNLQYHLPAEVVRRFRRSALVDIDPGLLQIWMSEGQLGDMVLHPGSDLCRPTELPSRKQLAGDRPRRFPSRPRGTAQPASARCALNVR